MRPLGAALALAIALAPASAAAFERQWHAGLDFGYAVGGFPDAAVSGFGGGTHLTYGISDAFNARLQLDLAAFDLPEPGTSALVWNAQAGAEYVFDVLEWVWYAGILVGGADVSIQAIDDVPESGTDTPTMTIDPLIGLGYQFNRTFSIGAEVRYRLMLFGEDTSPMNNLFAVTRLEVAWGY
jgi:outer membrane protein with beta-barrel domain